ncbi:putative bifunctional diguanylate cyclase/phosphodiesterase [Actinoplanes sp. NPDC051513]|uniref:putative bifunctional diguanylate cyclase/phosphodiesterase n=1 Tax=Actinoplanes sp. NPDC051513 TaxID=3363908 RepID=UPI0037AF4F2C
MRQAKVWRWWLAGGVAVTAGYFLLPSGSLAATLAYNAIGLLSGLAILAGVRLHRPERPGMWYWFAAGQLMAVAGDLVYEFYELVLHQEPYPSLADVFYLSSYPLVVVGLLLLVRRRGGGAAGLVEAAIIATGLGLAFWVFVLHPVAAESATTMLERWIGTTYPAADVLLLAMLARLFTGAGGRTASTRLIAAAGVLVLAADTAFSLVSLHWDADVPVINAGFLLSYLCWGAAALHPSMTAPEAGTAAAGDAVRPMRLIVFGVATMAAPALLLLPGVGGDSIDRRALAIGSVLLFLLVTVRMSQFMRRQRGQARELERLAMADDLTGLANRRRLELHLRDVPATACPQVALLGLNGFKNVNDELGRPAGDQVLAALAERIVAAAPPGALVARIGGDEFAVLLADAGADDAREMAYRLVSAFRTPVTADGWDLLVGVGIGLAGGSGLGPVELMRQAESAMHAAKLAGTPVRRWTPELDERSTAYARLGAELRTALDAGQFHMVYQPIVEVPSGRVHAVEALVRWDHPTRGTVSPAEFIPVAEQNGLIVELGAWILRTACLRLATWRASLGTDAPSRVSVNVSAKQLARPGFASFVASVLAATGLPASCLAVEVTETAVFEGGPAVTALHELKALGVRIALDDFGTGHSSLGLLQTVPVDTIKVDKSFVDDITSAGRQAVIAETLIRLSDGLGLAAVAEGVETAEQAAALTRLGYRYLQGYLYGRPVADPDFGRIPAAA